MRAWPESLAVERFIRRVRRRLILLRAIEGAAAGAGLGALLIAASQLPGAAARILPVALLIGTAMVVRVGLGDRWQFGWWRSAGELAVRAERRAPECRNLVVTAAQLLRGAPGAGTYVGGLVMQRAAALSVTVDPVRLFPARTSLAALATGVLLLVVSLAKPASVVDAVRANRSEHGGPLVSRVEVTVTPPAYSGIGRTTLVNPSRVEALASSRIEVRVDGVASSVSVETLSGTRDMTATGAGFTVRLLADADGFIAIEPRDSAGVAGSRRLIGLAVTPDRPPRVKLSSPGRDLFFATVPDSLPVMIEADDDIALASLRLQYTAVSGSGERFTFTERDVPLRVSALRPDSWRARGTWRLDQLRLTPGDLVVYRAIATDKRPGAPAVLSESYVIEVVTPGAIAAEGFAADDQRDRYAASQQMVILKTERLIAGRGGMTADSIAETARLLAAEQRQVRAEFVFMMGGELEDAVLETAGTLDVNETAEAEAEGDLLAGRQQNQGRVDMMRAIRAMSRASSSLTDTNLDEALRAERLALDNLMRAFARSRFILRALTQRERIDLSRRLGGTIGTAPGFSGPVVEPVLDDRIALLRRLLREVASLQAGSSELAAANVRAAAMALLRADPASDSIRSLVVRVQDMAQATPASRMERIDDIVSDVSRLIAMTLPVAGRQASPLDAAAFEGAWRDARLRTGGRR